MNGFGLDLLGLITDALPQIQRAGSAGVIEPIPNYDPRNPGTIEPIPNHDLTNPATIQPLGDIGILSGMVPQPPIPPAPLPLMPGESAGIPTPQYGGLGRAGGSRRSAPRIPLAPRPRKPSRVTGNAGVDLTNLDLGELLFLVLHPQGPQVLTLMSQAQQQKRQEDIQRQQIALERAQMERSTRAQDMQTRMIMNQANAKPVGPIQPGFGSDFLRQGTAGRRVTAPSGEEFLLPSAEDQRKAAAAERAAKIREAAEAKVAERRALDEYEDSKKRTVVVVPGTPFLQDPITARIDPDDPVEMKKVLELREKLTSGDLRYQSKVEDDYGNVRIIGVDPRTNQPVVYEFGRYGKTKTPPAASTAGAMTASGRMAVAKEFETAKREADDTATAYNRLIEAKKNGDTSVTDAIIQQAKDKADSARAAFHAVVERAKAAGWQMDKSGVGIDYKKQPSATAGAGPNLTQSLEERSYALQRYREMKKNGSPDAAGVREWFKRRYGLDPDTLP